MNLRSRIITTALIFGLNASICLAQTDGLKIHHLGANHTLVQIKEAQKYILLPIEEAAPEATISVLVNNHVDQTIQVRLAMKQVDYWVPLQLDAYQGKHVTLNIHTGKSHTDIQQAKTDACWKQIKLSNTYNVENQEKFRPLYHHTPLYGWMNDPNGMFYKDGIYHLYYQYNPYGSMWGNMHWAHSSSKDLMHWEHHPIAIAPDGLGTVFSGSSVVDKQNTAGFGKNAVIAIYTSAGASQMQSLAYSTDNGLTFTTYPENPIITSDKTNRDPNMFWHEESSKWVMVLASPSEKETWIYSSSDLKNWTKESSFGKGYGEQNGIWECPDLVKLPVRGTKESKWVLICNLNPGGPFGGSATQYFIGDFDGKKFTCMDNPEEIKWMDYGKDHYATVSWSNAPEDRHIVVAWMSNWQYANQLPTQQFRSANSLPRDLDVFKDKNGEYYLGVVPSPEVKTLRTKEALNYGSFSLDAEEKVTRELPTANSGICEIGLELNGRSGSIVNIELSNAKGEKTILTYNLKDKTFSMDRTQSGITDFSKDFPAVTVAPCPQSGKQHLRLFIDRCSMEAFDAEGHFAMTNLVFPEEPYTTLTLSASTGKCKVSNLTVYPLSMNK